MGLDLERQSNNCKCSFLVWACAVSSSESWPLSWGRSRAGKHVAASPRARHSRKLLRDSWSRRSPGSCSAHCCQPAASLLPDPWACWWEWHNYLIPAQGDLGHMRTDGGPGGFRTVQYCRSKGDKPGRGLVNGPGFKRGSKVSFSPGSSQASCFSHLNRSSGRKTADLPLAAAKKLSERAFTDPQSLGFHKEEKVTDVKWEKQTSVREPGGPIQRAWQRVRNTEIKRAQAHTCHITFLYFSLFTHAVSPLCRCPGSGPQDLCVWIHAPLFLNLLSFCIPCLLLAPIHPNSLS